MITFLRIVGRDGRAIVLQKLTHPAVYLDTWAVRLFAEEDPALRVRFRRALRRVGGTLMLSTLGMGEFTFDDPRHAHLAGQFVDELYPNLFFSHFDPFKVIQAELEVIVRRTRETPAGDGETLALFATAAEQRGYPSVLS